MGNKLAFDIGAYTGDTTETLLKTYEKVVCLDANPHMIRRLKAKYNENNNVRIIEGCISDSKEPVTFYISRTNTDWSSANREIAERLKSAREFIKVKPINILDVINEYGCPDYLKCDIEGSDIILLNQLKQSDIRPNYISCESECIGNRDINLDKDEDMKILNALHDLDYNKFILVNQFNNNINESNFKMVDFSFSGLENMWIDYQSIKTLIRSIDRRKYSKFGFWFDIIAKK